MEEFETPNGWVWVIYHGHFCGFLGGPERLITSIKNALVYKSQRDCLRQLEHIDHKSRRSYIPVMVEYSRLHNDTPAV